jgi:hypothetical protein
MGKGGRNIITRSDLEQAFRGVLKNLSATEDTRPSAVDAGRELRNVSQPEVLSAPAVAPTNGTIAGALALIEDRQDWNHMTKAEIEMLDEALRGRICEIISVLTEWALFRANDVPAVTEYITGQRMRNRAPEDFVRRLLKLDPAIRNRVAASQHVSMNSRLRDIIDSCSAEWKRRTNS